jgi:hypothetical protein
MTWVKVNGISVKLEQGATVADYDGEVGVATARMIQFRETWGDDKYFAIHRTPTFTCQRVNGEDQVIMGPVPVEPDIHEDEKPIRINPDSGFVPAFHTFNGAGEFIGLTVCLAGKWGPPYYFLAGDQDMVWPFEYGQWNTYDGATRPVDYDKMSWVGVSGNEDLFEIPADHDYVMYNTEKWVVITQGPYSETVEYYDCDGDQCKFVWLWGETYRKYEYNPALVDDWDAWWNDFHTWKETAIRLNFFWNNYADRDYYFWNGCVFAPEHYASDSEGWFCAVREYISEWTYYGVGASYGRSYTTATYRNGTIKACFVFGETYIDRFTHADTVPWPGLLEEWGYDNYTAADFVYVFGNIYSLRNPIETSNQQYSFAPEKVNDVKPRMYETEGDDPKFLCSFYRKGSQNKWEYLYFDNNTEQYNDPEAMYDMVDDTKHSLPITVGGEQVYGNGEFSLLLRDDQEFDITRPRGIYYDDPDRPLTEE